VKWCGKPVVIDEAEFSDIVDAQLDVIFAHADKESISDVVLMEDVVKQSTDKEIDLPDVIQQSDGWNLVAAVNVKNDAMIATISVDRCNLDVLGFKEFIEGERNPWTFTYSTLEDGRNLPTSTVVIFLPPRSSRGVFALRLRPPIPPGLDLEGDELINHLNSQVEILTDYIDRRKMKDVINQSNELEEKCGGTIAIDLPLSVPTDPEAGYLITQGFCGRLTHYLPQTLYSVDLRAEIGTPIIAPYSGTIVNISQKGTKASGIHVSNLYSFSSMMIKFNNNELKLCRDDKIEDVYVEFTHIQDYQHWKIGQKISKGDRIASVGQVGFAPEPHLHLQVYLSEDEDALPIRFKFKNIDMNKSKIPLNLVKYLKSSEDHGTVVPMTGLTLRPISE